MASVIEMAQDVLIAVGEEFGQDYDPETDSWICKCGVSVPDNNNDPQNYVHWSEHAAAALHKAELLI